MQPTLQEVPGTPPAVGTMRRYREVRPLPVMAMQFFAAHAEQYSMVKPLPPAPEPSAHSWCGTYMVAYMRRRSARFGVAYTEGGDDLVPVCDGDYIALHTNRRRAGDSHYVVWKKDVFESRFVIISDSVDNFGRTEACVSPLSSTLKPSTI